MKKLFSFILILTFIQTIFLPTGFAASNEPLIKSKSAILLEANTDTILYEENKDEKKYPASVTKVATAIYALEHAELSTIITVSKNARNAKGTRVYLEEGEQATLEKLLYGLMINSGNDAATAIAEHVSGSEEVFAKEMTEYFKRKLQLKNTNFTNASGLFDENHYTTAYDMAKIVRYAMNNEQFMEFYNTKELRWTGETWDTTIESHHRIVNGQISYEGITGGKNGYVPESRYTLSTTAERGDMHLIAIVLDSGKNEVYQDTLKLLNYGFENFQLNTIPAHTTHTKGDKVYQNIQSISFYTLLNTTYSSKIKDSTLYIYNQQDELITSKRLLENKPVTLYHAVTKSSIEPTLISDEEEPSRTMIGGLLIVVFICILFFSRIK